jgi:hypothetical protein
VTVPESNGKGSSLRAVLRGLGKRCARAGPEPFLWLAALAALALMDPSSGNGISICPLHNLGITWCPGCGLGRSVSLFLRGDIPGSFRAHILGMPAAAILVCRAASMLKDAYQRPSVE